MKLNITLILLFGLLVSAKPSQQQADDSLFIRKIADNIIKKSSCREDLLYLTKTIGGRPSGSSKMFEAEQWGFDRLKESGADTVWKQTCNVVHWERGGNDSAFISYIDIKSRKIRKKISVLALGLSCGTGSSGLKTRLVRISSFEELDSCRDDVSGSIVFFNPRFNPGADPISEYSRISKYRTRGSSKASSYGVKGIIVRSLTNSIDSFPHIGGQFIDTKVPIIPAVSVSTADANLLDELLDGGIKIDAEIYTHGKNFPDTTGHNIIGELKGREFPDHIITIGAHLDSWDVSEGASDDGTGVVITIGLLKALKESGYKPRNTIRFVLFADEENGINGASEYAKIASEKNEKHLFAIESDAGAFAPFSIGTIGFSKEGQTMLQGFSYLFKPYQGGGWINDDAADLIPLNRVFKIPIASLWTDQEKYFKVHHSPSDTFENTDINQIRNGAINVAAMIYLVEKYNLK